MCTRHLMIYLFGIVLGVFLFALAWIDLREFRLPDRLTLPLTLIGLVQAYVLNLDWQASLIGAAVGYVSFVALEIAYKKLRGKPGLGRGDAKLLAAGGAWCGWIGLPLIVFVASGSGLLTLLFPSFRKQADKGHIPFGPFLAFGIGMVWISSRLVAYPA